MGMVVFGIILVIMGLAALGISFKLEPLARGWTRIGGAGGAVVGVLFCLIAGGRIVEPGHVGVPILFGQVQDYTLDEGFHIVNPFLDVDQMTVQTQTITMSGDTKLSARAGDQTKVFVDISVIYHLEGQHAPGVRRYFPDYQTGVVESSVRTAVRDAIGGFGARDAVSSKRTELDAEMNELMRERLGGLLKGRGLSERAITVDEVQLRRIELPQELQVSIAKVQQEALRTEEMEQARLTADQNAEVALIKANSSRAVAKIAAERDAEVRTIRAAALAKANDTVTKSLTPTILKLRAIEAMQDLARSEGNKVIIFGGGSDEHPVILDMGQ